METEEERQARRRARIAQMKRAKRRRELLYKWGVPAIAALVVVTGVGIGLRAAASSGGDTVRTEEGREVADDSGVSDPEEEARHSKSSFASADPFQTAARAASPRTDLEQISEGFEVPMAEPEPVETVPPLAEAVPAPIFEMNDDTELFSEDIYSQYGIFVDVESGAILAQKEAYTRMNPA